MIYIRLFHGRTDPTQDMDDWGTDGPIFGPYEFAHTTYKSILRLGRPDGTCDELYCYEDMLCYDGVFYGDWTVFGLETLGSEEYMPVAYDQAKANLPT